MSFNISATPSTTSTVTISGAVTTAPSIEAPASTQTVLNIQGQASQALTQNTWVDIASYTVTAGKTGYLTGCSFSLTYDGSYGAPQGFFRLYDVTNSKYVICQVFPNDQHTSAKGNGLTTVMFPPVSFAANTNVKLQFCNLAASTTLISIGRIFGVEQ